MHKCVPSCRLTSQEKYVHCGTKECASDWWWDRILSLKGWLHWPDDATRMRTNRRGLTGTCVTAGVSRSLLRGKRAPAVLLRPRNDSRRRRRGTAAHGTQTLPAAAARACHRALLLVVYTTRLRQPMGEPAFVFEVLSLDMYSSRRLKATVSFHIQITYIHIYIYIYI